MLIRALACLRAVQFGLWVWVPFVGGPGRYPPQVLICFIVAAFFSATLFTVAIRREELSGRWVSADVALAAVYAVVVSRAYPPAEAASITNWVIPPLCGVAVTAAIYAGRHRLAAVALVVAAWMFGAWPAVGTDSTLELFSNSAMMTLFAGVAGITGKLLLGAARDADAATARAVTAEGAAARAEERTIQQDRVHDYAMHTLLTIARGARTMEADQIERLATRELEFLRTMMTVQSGGAVTGLGESLAVMIRRHAAQETLDRVESTIGALPPDLPQEVLAELTAAACEAMNNVVTHARTDRVRLTASTRGASGVRITVVDPGIGFEPSTVVRRGLDRSFDARLDRIGGLATVTSSPGEGTTVELIWPK